MATFSPRSSVPSVASPAAVHSQPLAGQPLRRLSVAMAAALGATIAPSAFAATVTHVAVHGGFTGTTVSTSGATTTVNSTLAAGQQTAFNAFSSFTVASTDTVNLVLPTGAKNLVNIVDTQAIIDGTVNSYMGSVTPGVYGGHVFFADPSGFVLGATGKINVGALSVAAVSAATHDMLLADATSGTDTATTALLKGTVDHDNADVSIQGTVTATQGVRIQAHAIDVTGTIFVAGDSGTDGLVTTVNTGTPATASDILNDQGIRLQGTSVALEKGGVLHAAGTLASANNDVNLVADVSSAVNSGSASSSSSILVDGTVIAANVIATATAEAIADYADASQVLTTSVTGETILGNTSSLPIGLELASSSARVEIGADATVTATGNVNLLAQSHAVASTSALNAATDDAVVAAAIYGQITGNTTAQIDAGAHISAGGALTVEASHAHEMKLTSTVNGSSQSAIATAIGYVDTDTQATVATGAVITAGSVSVLSNNQASYAVESSIKAAANSPAGINAGILVVDTSSTATEGANLGSSAAPIGAVTVSATSTTSEASVNTQTAIGQDASGTPMMVVSGEGAGLGTLLQNELGAFFSKADTEAETRSESEDGETPPNEDSNTTSALRAGMSVSLLDVTQHANASIAPGTVIQSGGNVVVNGNVTSAGTSNAASTATTSSTDASASVAASIAVSVGLVDNDASAIVGSGAQINAANIGVNSTVSVPWDLSGITTFSLVPSELETIYDLLKNSGQPLTTSYANATSDSTNIGLAGAVSYFSLGDSSTAWVDTNAKLTTTGAATPWSATIALGANPTDGTALPNVAVNFAAPVSVDASNQVQTIEDAGNFDLTSLNGTKAAAGSDAVGGGVNIVDYDNTTLAGIGTGVVVNTAALAVAAQDTEQLVSITPTAGRGGGVAGNVIFAMADTDDTTHASISSGADVNAGSVALTATESLGAWSIAGAISQGTGTGIGVAVAIDDLTGSTQAYIGNNSADSLLADPTTAGMVSAAVAAMNTNSLTVTATTDGSSGAIAFSGAAAKEDTSEEGSGGGSSGSGGGSGTPPTAEPVSNDDSPGFVTEAATDGTNATSAFSISGLLAKIPVLGDLLSKAQTAEGKSSSGAGGAQTKPSFGLALSGSSSVNLADLDSQASVTGVTIGTYGSGTASNINVQALNETDLISAAGAGALAAAGKTAEGSAGVAGAVSYSEIGNTTGASLGNVTAAKAGTVTVQALSGGSVIDLGLGLAANTQSGADNDEAAGSFSITQITSATTASIAGSSLTTTGSTNAVQVDAYDRTDIGAGGGSLAVGGNTGVGVAITYSDIASQVAASIDGGTLNGFGAVSVQAVDAARIAAGAASVAVSSGSTSTDLSGAFVFNIIHGSTSANIDDGASLINTHGNVTVAALGSGPVAAYDALLTANGVADSAANMIDFSGGEIGANDASGAAIFGVAGSLSVGGNSGGLSFAYNSVADSFSAGIVDATVNTTGTVAVSAVDDTRIIGFAVGIGGSTGDFAGVGSATADLIDDVTTATVGDATGATATTINASALGVNAVNSAGIDTLAGNVTIGKGAAAAGLAISYNAIGEQTAASITHTTVTTTGSAILTGCAGAGAALSATACTTGAINSAAVGIAGSTGAIALTASLAMNDIGTEDPTTLSTLQGAERADSTIASIGNSTLTTQGISVQAIDASAIQTLAGAVAVSEDAGAGAGFAFENIGANTSATLSTANVAATGAVAVDAVTTGSIKAIAVGGAVSGDIAFGGSLTDNAIANQTLATVSGVQGVTGGGAATMTSLDVSATDSAAISSLAGALSVGVSGVGIGGASSIDTIGSITTASLAGSDISASLGVTVDASATAAIQTLAAVGAGGADAGIAGAVTTNDITNAITAQITGTTLTDTGNTVSVDAVNSANILSSADSVAVSGGVSAGAAIATNRIGSTVKAQIEGGTVTARDVLLSATGNTANSDGSANIRTLAAGVGGGSVGIAASLAINIESGSVLANIGSGATVKAADNIGVIAANNQSIDVIAGSLGVGVDAVGLGLGTVVDELNDSVTASVTGASTHVDAQGANAADAQLVASGTLANTPGDLASVVMTSTTPNMAEGTKGVVGLAINAQSEQAVTAIGVSAALAFDPLGSAAISAMVGDTSLGGSTSAYIADASVNRDQTPIGSAAVDVTASSQQYAGSFIAGIAGGASDFSGAAAIDVTSFSRDTQAYVDNATLTAAGALNVDAYATQRSASLATGLSGSIVGGAATGITNRFAGTTAASIDRGAISAGSIGVAATSENDASMNGGSAAFGAAALSGTMLLSSSSNTTDAYIGDTGGTTTLTVPGAVNVAASSTTSLSSLMVSGAGAGGPAVAGMAAITEVGNHTNAYLQNTLLDASGSAGASLGVTASENITLTPESNAAAASLGAVGAGAAANVVLLDSQVGAAIQASTAHVGGIANVQATSNKTIDALTISGALGADAGISGATSVIVFGNGSLASNTDGSNPNDELNKSGDGTLAQANSFGSGSAIGSSAGTALSSGELASLDNAGKVTLLNGSGNLNQGLDGTTANIAGSTVIAGSVTVQALDTGSVRNIVGNLAGGVVGAGGAVAISVVNDTVGASVDGSSQVFSGGAIDVTATVNNGTIGANGHTYALDTEAYQGAFGFVGLGAAVAYSELDNTVTASLGGTAQAAGGAVNVTATDNSALYASGGGAVGGGLAAGVVVSQSHKSSDVEANTGGNARVTAATVNVAATDGGRDDASATAVGAGLLAALNGADANTTDSSIAKAQVGADSAVATSGTITVQATDSPTLDSQAFGVAVSGGVSIGASVATADLATQVTATTGDGAIIQSAGLVTVQATQDANVTANATGGAGGALVGANASVGTASSTSTVTASTGNNVTLPAAALDVFAHSVTNQMAGATGVGVGFIGVGASVADAEANTTTSAALGSNNLGAGLGAVSISAISTDSDNASVTSGSGGVISGNAAVATTSDTASTTAGVGAGTTLAATSFNLNAVHNDDYVGTASAVGAGLANASGAGVDNLANSSVAANVGPNTGLFSTGFITIGASNNFVDGNPGVAVQGGGGGVLSGAAAVLSSTLTGSSNVTFGTNSLLAAGLSQAVAQSLATKYNDQVFNTSGNIFASSGAILISAGSNVDAQDTATLDSGGLVAGSGVSTSLNASMHDAVTLSSNDQLITNGDLGIGTYSIVDAGESALTHTYGGGAQGAASATDTINSTQNVDIGSNDTLLAFGQLRLTAGEDATGTTATGIVADANGQAYVRGIIAIATGSADTTVNNTGEITIGTGASALAGGNVTLGTYLGTPSESAEGTGHGYELGFIPITTDDASTGGSTSGSATINGTVIAGVYANSTTTIDANGNVTHTGAPLYVVTDPTFSPYAYIAANSGALSSNTESDGNTGVPTGTGTAAPTAPNAPVANNNGDDDTETGTAPTAPPSTILTGGNTADVDVGSILDSTVTQFTTTALELGSLYAAGGNVTLHTDAIHGSGSVTANGSPQVTVTNNSPDYLVLSSITIPDASGGQVLFTGNASAANAGALTVKTDTSTTTPSVTITSTWDKAVASHGESITQGPAIFIAGEIDNDGGLVAISNVNGSVGQFAPISAQQITESVPNGAVAVYLPNGTYNSGSDPIASFAGDEINLGDANSAINYVVNAIFNPTGAITSSSTLTNTVANQGQLLGGFTAAGASYVFFGNCAADAIGDCSGGTASSYNGSNTGFFNVSIPTLAIENLSKTVGADNRNLSTGVSALNAQIIAVQAKYIDIDSAIVAGHDTNQTVTINSNFSSFVAANLGVTGLITVPASYWSTTAPTTTGATPLVQYNGTTGVIVVNNINASGGGFVTLNGGIISTAAIGNITINDGYGNVTINNLSNTAVQIADINTGNNALGELKITDTNQTYDVNGTSVAQTHWYVNQAGVGTTVYNNSNGATEYSAATVQTTAANGATLTYTPETGLRYEWQEEANLSRGVSLDTNSNWTYVDADGVATSTPVYTVIGTGVVSDTTLGNFGTPAQLENTAFTETVTGSASYGTFVSGHFAGDASVLDVLYHGCGGTGSSCHFGFRQSDNDGTQNIGVWQYIYESNAQVITTSSVKADYGIGINFSGNATASVNINSGGSILLTGGIYNPGGNTTLNASTAPGTSITASAGSSILTKGLSVTAGNAIGSAAAPLNVTMTGGTLSANAGSGGVYVDAQSAVSVDHITAGETNGSTFGNVSLTATGSITGSSAGSLISGGNITLNSTSGGVGTTAVPLDLYAHDTLNSVGGYAQGVVNVSAVNDIGIDQIVGDLQVGSIASSAGNVTVQVPTGSIVDAADLTSGQALSAAQLATVSADLHLTDSDGASTAAFNNTILSFQAAVDANYQSWWQFRENGTVNDGVYTLTNIELYRGLAAASEGVAASSLSDAQINAYAQSAYTAATTYLSTNVADFATATAFQSFDATYAYTATAAQQLALTSNATYTTGQLTSAINSNALGVAASTPVGSATPNITGRTVNLSARNNIGALGQTATIDAADLTNGTLSQADLAALAAANAPGDVTLVKDANGNITQIEVNQTQPLFLTASGTVSAATQAGFGGSIYLQANGNLALGGIAAADNVRLVAVGNITDTLANPLTPVITASGDLTMLSGNTGSIGTAAAPISYQIGGILLGAEAGQDVAVHALGGDLVFDEIAAGGTATLLAPTASIFQAQDGLSIKANSIDLVAGVDVGYLGDVAKNLEVETGDTGVLFGSAGGNAMLFSPTAATQFSIGSFTTGGDMTVTSAGKLDATSLIAGGALTVSSGDDATFGTLVSAGALSVASLGNIAVQSATSAMVTGTGVSFDAAGAIAGTDDGSHGANITAQPNAAVTLQAGTGIGAPLRIDAAHVTATSNSGDIAIAMMASLASGNITAKLGSVTLSGTGDLDFTAVTAAQDATVLAAGTISGTSVAATAGNAVVTAPTGINVGTVIAGTDATLTATQGAIALGQATSGGAMTLDAQGTIGATALSAGSTLGADSTAASIAVTTLGAGTDATLEAALDIDVTSASTGGNIGVTAGTDAIFGTFGIGGAATLGTGTSLDITAATVGAGLVADTGSTLHIGTATVNGDASLTSQDAMLLGTVGSTNDLTATAGTTTNASLTATDLSAGRDLTLTGYGAIAIADAGDAGRNLGIGASGALSAHDLTSLAATSLLTGGATAVDNANAGTTFGATAGASASYGTLLTGGMATLGAGTSLDIGTATIGAGLLASAGGTMHIASGTVTGDATLTSTGAMQLDNVRATHDLTATAGDTLTATDLHADRDLSLTGDSDIDVVDQASAGGSLAINAMGALTAHDLTSVADTTLTTGGASTVEDIDAGTTLNATAGSSARIGEIDAGSTANIATGSSLDVTNGHFGDSLVASAGTNMHFGTATVAGDATLTSLAGMQLDTFTVTHDLTGMAGTMVGTGPIVATTLTAGNDLTLHGASDIAIDTASAGNTLALVAGGDLAANSLSSVVDTSLTSATATSVGKLTAGTTLVANAGSSASFGNLGVGTDATIGTGSSLDFAAGSVGHDLVANVGTDATIGTATIGDIATLDAGQAVDIGTASTGNNLNANAGASLHVGTATAGHDALLTAGTTMQLDNLNAARDIYGTANDDMGFGTLVAGRDIVLTSRHGHVQGTDLTAGRTLDIAAQTDIGFTDATSGSNTALTAAAGSIDGGLLVVGSTLAATAGTDIDLGTANVTNGVTLAAGRDIGVGSLATAAGSVIANSGRDMTLGAYQVNGDINLNSGRDMNLGSGTNTGTLGLTLGGNLDFSRLTSQGTVNIDAYGGSIHGGDLITDQANLGALDGIMLDTSHIGTQLNLAAADIDANVIQTTTQKPISMLLTGYHNGVAKEIVMDVHAPTEWLIQRLAAVQAVLNTSAPETAIVDGTVTKDMWLYTPMSKLYMNNVSPTLVDADEQFYEPGTTFNLWQVGKTTLTDAFVSRYTVGFDVTVPNYIDSHLWTALDYYGGSVLRYLGSTITLHGPDDLDNRDENKVDTRIHGGAHGPNDVPGDDVVHGGGVDVAAVNLGASN